MKAIIIDESQHLHWEEFPTPTLGSGEILIEVHAAALNRADLLQREGKYPPPPGAPNIMGLEVSGVVAALSPEAEVEGRFNVGDRVCALLGGGGYAEYVAMPSVMCMPIPDGLSMVEAAALPEAFATAYLNLRKVADAKPGETLLMHAGASGLASVVIPMAKAMGLRVITTVRGAKKAELVKCLAADRIVDLKAESISDVLREEEAAGHPVNVAIDCLGGDMLGECLPYVARGCRWIVIATLAGDISAVDFRNVYVKNIRLIGSTLRSKSPEEKGEILSELVENFWGLISRREIPVKIHAVLPITEAERAHEMLYCGENVGKVVLTVKE